MDILNSDSRVFQSWGSVEVVDSDDEVIPMSEFKKIMPVIMDRGGILIDQHSNKQVGKILNYEFKTHKETDKEGVLLTCKIFNNYKSDESIWKAIKSGQKRGLSFGGNAGKTKMNFRFKDFNGNKEANILSEIEGYEFSVVDNPANPFATMTDINAVAKTKKDEIQKPFAGYKDLEAYCASIKRLVEDKTKEEEIKYNSYEDCIKQNYDRDDKEKYCKIIMGKRDTMSKVKKDEETTETEETPESKDTVETTKEDGSEMTDRLASFEARLQKIEESLAPAEDAKTKAEEGDEEEDDKKPKDNEDDKDKDKSEGDEDPETSDVTKLSSEVKELKKSIAEFTKSMTVTKTVSTPRQKAVTKEHAAPEIKKSVSETILDKSRKGEKVNMSDIKKMVADNIKD